MLARAFALLCLLAGSVHAQSADVDVQAKATVDFGPILDQLAASAPGLERVAKGAFRRARRAVSIGPTIGVFGGLFPDAEQADVALSFGIGVELFKVPILPTPDNIKALVLERAKEKLKSRQIGTGDVQQIVREAWDEAIKELFGLEGIPYKTMEKPRLSLGLEGNRYFDGEAWAVRLRAGIGISKITLAASFAAAFTEPETAIYAGLELVAHVMVAKQPRSSVIDVFVRADLEVANRDVGNADFFGVGVRYLLDVF